jgi:cytoskeletal protein CcmA (bactofilin family)
MTNIGRGIAITGTVRSEEPLAIAGKIKGDVVAADHEVTLENGSDIDGAVMARTIVVLGKITSGRLVGRDAVRLQKGASVQADIATPRFAMEDGATFNGRVDPSKVDAAFKVAEHREMREEPKPQPPSMAADKGRP